jgi:O-antigen/teichoic acid export membrane protein
MTTFSLITRNTLYQSLGKAVSIFASLFTTAILTRHLGQSGYGQYTLISAVIIFFSTLTDWGTGFIATRLASQKKFSEPQIYGNLLILRIMASIVGAVVMIVLGIFQIVNLPIPLIFLGSLVIFALAVRNAMQIIFQVHLKLQYGAIVEAASGLGFFLITVWAVTQTALTPATVVFYLLISSALAGIIAIYFAKKLSPISYNLNHKLISHLLKESAPMGALLVVFSIYNRLDSFILQHYQGDQAVGIYGLAYKVHDNLVMGAAFFMNAMYPLIAKSKIKHQISKTQIKDKKELAGNLKLETRNLFSTSFHFLTIVGLFISVIFFLFAKPVIFILAGPDYLIAVDLLRILMIATFIAYLNHLTGYTLAAIGLQRVSLTIAVTALAINLTLNFIFVPIYSYYASAWITIVTEAIVLIFSLVYLIKIQHLTPRLLALPSTLKNLLSNRRQLF